jgi:hypothetical protein
VGEKKRRAQEASSKLGHTQFWSRGRQPASRPAAPRPPPTMAATGCSQRSLHVLALTAAGVGGAAYMSRRCCTTHDDGNDDDGQDSGGVVTIAGYGSLMDEQSARATTPSIRNWRCALSCLGRAG